MGNETVVVVVVDELFVVVVVVVPGGGDVELVVGLPVPWLSWHCESASWLGD